MKKHFLIKSIRRDQRRGDEEGWIQYEITPITNFLKVLSNLSQEHSVSIEVYGVKGPETAVITASGPRAKVKKFPTYLAETNFYEAFSLREVEYPDIYL